MIEGHFVAGEGVVLLEDVITTGGSAIRGAEVLQAAGLQVETIVVLLDREEGGREKMEAAGYSCHPILRLSEVVAVLAQTGRLAEAERETLGL